MQKRPPKSPSSSGRLFPLSTRSSRSFPRLLRPRRSMSPSSILSASDDSHRQSNSSETLPSTVPSTVPSTIPSTDPLTALSQRYAFPSSNSFRNRSRDIHPIPPLPPRPQPSSPNPYRYRQPQQLDRTRSHHQHHQHHHHHQPPHFPKKVHYHPVTIPAQAHTDSNDEDSITTDYSDDHPSRQIDDARSSENDSPPPQHFSNDLPNLNQPIDHSKHFTIDGHILDDDEDDQLIAHVEAEEEDTEDEEEGEQGEERGEEDGEDDDEEEGEEEEGNNDQDDDDDDDDDDDNSITPNNDIHDEYDDESEDNLALRPVSTPDYATVELHNRRSSSANSSRRSAYSNRMADVARAARDNLSRRWSFYRRPADRPPSESSQRHTPTPMLNSRGRNPPQRLDQRNDFMSPAFTSPIGNASVDPFAHTRRSPLRPPPPQSVEAINIPVKAWVLQGNGTIPRKNTRLASLSKRLGPSKNVMVESNLSGLAPVVLYASDQVSTTTRVEPFKATESITSRPEYVDRHSIVYNDSPFEIDVVGMSISSQDFKLGYPDLKDVLLYSMQREPGEQGEEGDAMPLIHFDPTRDDGLRGIQPDQFVSIPASRSQFMTSDGSRPFQSRKSINCRFKLLELQRVDECVQSSLTGIEQLGNHFQQYSVSAPALGLLSPAMSLASVVSKRALESHATSDRMITIDMNFLLAERRTSHADPRGNGDAIFESRSGEYLRYGYYFFLTQGVEAKLYASFRTFPNVGLMMKRVDRPAPNEKQFFPLTGVSYVVIRVSPRVTSNRVTRKPIRLRHVQRLEELMGSAMSRVFGGRNSESCEALVRKLASLGEELGISNETKSSVSNTLQVSQGVNEDEGGTDRVSTATNGGTMLKPNWGDRFDHELTNEGATYISSTTDAFALTGLTDWRGNPDLERLASPLPTFPLPHGLERSSSLTAVDGDQRRSSENRMSLPHRPS